jgi:hypothetical protein
METPKAVSSRSFCLTVATVALVTLFIATSTGAKTVRSDDTRPVETQCKMAVAKVIQATGMELREISKTSPYLPESKTMAFALKHPLVPDDDYAAELNCLTMDSLNLLITSVDEYPPSAWFNLVAKGGAALTGASVQTVRKAIDECYAKTLGSEADEITEIVKQLFTVDCSRMPPAGITMTVFQPLN